ncbi:anti-sigma factor family protein [Rhodanobacter aciditrophus]|uniref:anti-sigma factor family protein n=1 Tax=Rhodanobacter aciditrophus TaxID=1623218 RepID=UPI003CE998B6
MNPIDDDILQAYVDGELDAAEAARIDAALAQDEVLARRVRQARALKDRLHAAFDPVLDEPVPARLSALLQSQARPAALSTVPERGRGADTTRRRAPRRWLMPGAALAASIALLAVGLWWHAGNELVRVRNGEPYAAGVLGRALDQALASEPDAHAPVSIGLSFRAADGQVCRTFTVHTAPARAGLACHTARGWALPVLEPSAPAESGELRQAASSLPPAVQAAVDARLRGEVFDAQQERAARAAGWR